MTATTRLTLDPARAELLRSATAGTLATTLPDGRPHLTTVTHAYDEESGEVVVVITARSVKAGNLARDPRVTLHVATPDAGRWLAVEGTAVLAATPHRPDAAPRGELLTLRFAVTRVYGWPR